MPLPLLQPATGRCKAACPSGSYADPSGICVQCDASCAACTGPGAFECSSCDPVGVASHLRAGACVDSCGGGYYAEDQPLVRTCQPCHASCQACTGPRASQCSACKADACAKSNCPPSRKPHLDGSSCLSTCPVRSLSPPPPTAHHHTAHHHTAHYPSPITHRSPLTTHHPPSVRRAVTPAAATLARTRARASNAIARA